MTAGVEQELEGLAKQNGATIGRLIANGNIGRAEEGPDGTATLNLDGPGYYWYGSPTGNDEGRGLTGAIVVMGDAPPEARLDRPPQPRP
jgi:hypothetical protein